MEEDIPHHFVSPIHASKLVEEKLKRAVDEAEDRLEREAARNEELLRALHIVREFIKRKKRVCYGGTAMNEILPATMKFYDPQRDLPDYDFYTPEPDTDVNELVSDLKAAGFKEVYHKVGMHEGTKKILVNFVPVADMSTIAPELFAILYRRSIAKDGVHYTDPDILRMMMYLELSRPKGEVDRWQKVFERLELVNKAFPPAHSKGGACAGGGHEGPGPLVPLSIRQIVFDYILENQRILCNGPIRTLYTKGIRRGKKGLAFELRPGGPILFSSPDPRADAVALKTALKDHADIRLFLHKPRGEIVPPRIEIRSGAHPVCLIVQEVACHSYNEVPAGGGRTLLIGSLEYLITLYLSLDIFTNHSREIFGSRAKCDVAEFIRLAGQNYRAGHSAFPAFSLTCKGHQVGFASLVRAKVERIKKEREAAGGPATVTRKRKRKGAAKKRKSSKTKKQG